MDVCVSAPSQQGLSEIDIPPSALCAATLLAVLLLSVVIDFLSKRFTKFLVIERS